MENPEEIVLMPTIENNEFVPGIMSMEELTSDTQPNTGEQKNL
jgi:hypothetical protein